MYSNIAVFRNFVCELSCGDTKQVLRQHSASQPASTFGQANSNTQKTHANDHSRGGVSWIDAQSDTLILGNRGNFAKGPKKEFQVMVENHFWDH